MADLSIELNQNGELNEFIFQNSDVIESVSNMFDFDKLLCSMDTSAPQPPAIYDNSINKINSLEGSFFIVQTTTTTSTAEPLFDSSDLQYLLDEAAPSPTSSSSSSSADSPPIIETINPHKRKQRHSITSDDSNSKNETVLNLDDDQKFLEQFDFAEDDDEDLDDEEDSSPLGYTLDRKGNMVPLVLTDEEKSVFKKEGFKLPSHMPLTKNEEKLLKLVRRKIRNKKSAHVSRERKKKYVDGLEKRVEHCTKENENLLKHVRLLKTQNTELMTKLKNMQTFVSALLNRHKKSSTAVLFVSFFITFCVYPFVDVTADDSRANALQMVMPFKGVSRTLLSTDVNLSDLTNKNPNFSSDSYDDSVWEYYKNRYDI